MRTVVEFADSILEVDRSKESSDSWPLRRSHRWFQGASVTGPIAVVSVPCCRWGSWIAASFWATDPFGLESLGSKLEEMAMGGNGWHRMAQTFFQSLQRAFLLHRHSWPLWACAVHTHTYIYNIYIHIIYTPLVTIWSFAITQERASPASCPQRLVESPGILGMALGLGAVNNC